MNKFISESKHMHSKSVNSRNGHHINSSIDIAIMCVILFSLLFNIIIGPLTPIILLILSGLFFVIRRIKLFSLFENTWPLIALPTFATLSSIWSIDPMITLKSSALYLLTVVVAIVFGSGTRNKDFLRAVFYTFLIFSILSWLVGYRQISYGAFQGLLASKNSMGEVGGALLLAAICVYFDALDRSNRFLCALSIVGLMVGAATLWFSEATTATIATVISAVCTTVWLLTIRLEAQSRIVLFVITLLFSAVIISFSYQFEDFILNYVLGMSGKDSTLTGRTDLWLASDDLIARRPWLGLGYNAFWHPGNLEAESLWRAFGIENRSGFNFHNAFREIAVHLGLCGLSLFMLVFFIGTISLFKSLVRSPTPALVFFAAILISSVIKSPFESLGLGSMQLFGILAFAAISAGFTSAKVTNRYALFRRR